MYRSIHTPTQSHPPTSGLEEKLQTTPVLTDLANLTHRAHRALELGVVLGAVERTFLVRCAAVDGRVAGRANFKLGKLVEFDLHRVVRVALALRLGLACLFENFISVSFVSIQSHAFKR